MNEASRDRTILGVSHCTSPFLFFPFSWDTANKFTAPVEGLRLLLLEVKGLKMV